MGYTVPQPPKRVAETGPELMTVARGGYAKDRVWGDACDSSRDSSLVVALTDTQRVMLLSGADWECRYCGSHNRAERRFCSQCQAPKVNSAKY